MSVPLTFANSAFVQTHGMPGLLHAFADNQHITQVVDAVRSFLLAQPVPPALPFTEKVVRFGAPYRREYRPNHGTTLTYALIAASVKMDGANLVTFTRRLFPMVSN